MKAEQEKISAKVRAVSMHLNGGKLQLPAEEESCYVVLVAESGCTLQYAEQTMLLNPGSALLLGPGGGCIQQTGSAAPELVGCSFPLSALHEMRTQTQRDFSRLFEPEQSAVLYGSVQWNSRLRTLLELMRTAMEEPDYPGALYLLLVLHYIEQECIAESSAVARPTIRRWSTSVRIWPPTTARSSPSARWQRGSTCRPTTSAACSSG